MMRVRVVDPADIDDAVIADAAAVIRAGGLVAFPTETVYGLGADATNAAAVARIFAAKGRPSYNPLIVHVSDADSAHAVVSEWPDTARDLATRFWPGPLTLVLPKCEAIPDIVTAGLPTVGVRVPAHPIALALIRAAARPIAAPSANWSTGVSPTDASHVAASLDGGPELILDAGPTSVGIESTVLDLSSGVPTILRPGMISRAQIAGVIGEVRSARGRASGAESRPSPGMLDRHYSPRARLIVVEDASEGALNAAVARESMSGARVAVLARSNYQSQTAAITRMADSPEHYARQLYATLHRLDADGFDAVIVQPVPPGEEWDGLRDRLKRASQA
jgi:L-threonylcarbamoyladenylate synthase